MTKIQAHWQGNEVADCNLVCHFNISGGQILVLFDCICWTFCVSVLVLVLCEASVQTVLLSWFAIDVYIFISMLFMGSAGHCSSGTWDNCHYSVYNHIFFDCLSSPPCALRRSSVCAVSCQSCIFVSFDVMDCGMIQLPPQRLIK